MSKRLIVVALVALVVTIARGSPLLAEGQLRAGIIGLDALARSWTGVLNAPDAAGELADMIVVAGYPGGSPDIPRSVELLKKGIEAFKQMNVALVSSIDALVRGVDVVMILSIDGRPHLEQARPVIEAGKPVFIYKPVAASLADAIKIYQLAEEHEVPCFASSSMRFAPGTQAVLRDPGVGSIQGCSVHGPCELEPHHPDLFWYGIHGVEARYSRSWDGAAGRGHLGRRPHRHLPRSPHRSPHLRRHRFRQ